MSKALADFYDLLLPELPGCTSLMLDLHLRETARMFCTVTSAWRETFDAIDLVAGQAAYDLAAPASRSELVRLLKVTKSGVLLWEDTTGRDCADAAEYGAEEPPFELSGTLDTLTLIEKEVPTADEAGGLVLVGALRPRRDATNLPDLLMIQYSEAIRFGVLSRLMAMGGKPWTDRDLAKYYDDEWQRRLGFAGYQADVGNTRKPLRVRMWG